MTLMHKHKHCRKHAVTHASFHRCLIYRPLTPQAQLLQRRGVSQAHGNFHAELGHDQRKLVMNDSSQQPQPIARNPQEHNSKPNTYSLAMNEFGDMTWEEVKKHSTCECFPHSYMYYGTYKTFSKKKRLRLQQSPTPHNR